MGDEDPAAALGAWSPWLRLAHDFATGTGFRLPERAIVDHALLYIASGVAECRIAGRAHALARGALMVVPPDVAHDIVAPPHARLRMLNLHFDPIERADSPRTRWERDARAPRRADPRETLALPQRWRGGAVHRVSLPAAYEHLFFRALAAFAAPGAAGALRRKAALGELLAWLHDDAAGADSRHDDRRIVERARAFIDRRCADAIGVREIAAAAGVGRTRLALAYRRCAGASAMADLRRARIERAKVELAYRGVPAKEAARRSGFADVHHFSRVFARLVGSPPAAWQRAARPRG